jgi:ABC-type nitrate/sulfonate/bicarbonate transport system substrate-binding protein
MWDPAKYPDAKEIKDLPKDVKVRVFGPAAYLNFLVTQGYITEGQIDPTYDGKPGKWLADNGKSAQQGFASAEPYYYEKELKEWSKPVAYQLVEDAGWTAYAAPLAVRSAEFDKNKECFKALVPIVQRATRDFVKSPDKTNALILDLVTKYDTGWVYTAGQAKASVEYQLKDGLVANSADGTLGSFDTAKVDEFIKKAIPSYEKSGAKLNKDVKSSDLVTNEFIDPSIKL